VGGGLNLMRQYQEKGGFSGVEVGHHKEMVGGGTHSISLSTSVNQRTEQGQKIE